MYVAITRARRRLYLTLAQSRMLHGQVRYNIASRFLDEIPRDLVQWLSPRRRAVRVRCGRVGQRAAADAPRAGARAAAGRRDAGARLAHRPERAPREVRRRRHHRRRRPRRRRARAGQLPRRRRQVAGARVREARSGVTVGVPGQRANSSPWHDRPGSLARPGLRRSAGAAPRRRGRCRDSSRSRRCAASRRTGRGRAAAAPARRVNASVAGTTSAISAVDDARAPRRRRRTPAARSTAIGRQLASAAREARAQRRAARAVLEHDERRREPQREHHRQRADRGEQHRELRRWSSASSASSNFARARTARRAACRRRPAPSPSTASVMPTTRTTPSGSSAHRLERKPWNSCFGSGVPPRSCVHAAARKPTANTGFSIGAASWPMNGTRSMTPSTR